MNTTKQPNRKQKLEAAQEVHMEAETSIVSFCYSGKRTQDLTQTRQRLCP